MSAWWPQVADLGAYLGRDVAANAGAQNALNIAVGLVQSRTKQHIEADAADTETISPRNRRRLILKQFPVTSVASVTVDGTVLAATAYDWDEHGVLTRLGGRTWGTKSRSVVVVYGHGLAACPDDLRGVVLQVAGRILDNPLGKLELATDGHRSSSPPVFPLEFSRAELAVLSNYADSSRPS